MFIKQISVFAENKAGAASDILDILSANDINIRALSIADTTEYGIMRLITEDVEKAKQVLQGQGILVKISNVLAVPIGDRPGGLAHVLKIFKDGQISVDYMYAFVGRNDAGAVVVVKTDDGEKAGALLKQNGIEPLCSSALF